MDNSNNLPVRANEKKSAKFDRFVNNIKFINYLIVIVTLCFIVMFCFCVNKLISTKQARLDAEANQREWQSLYNQYQIASNGQDIVSDNSQAADSQLFSNGKQAVIYAFQKLTTASKYEMKGHGSTTATAVNVSKTISIQNYGYKFASGVEYSQTFRYDSSSFVNQTAATESAYKNGKKYMREGTFTSNNGVYGGTFSSEFAQVQSQLTGRGWYIINKSSILKCTAFNITKVDGKIAYYSISVQLDPVVSTAKYGITISEEAGTSFPTFDYVNLDCIIDRAGNLISYDVVEEMNASKNVAVLGNVSAHTKNIFHTDVISINKDPSVAEPNIK